MGIKWQINFINWAEKFRCVCKIVLYHKKHCNVCKSRMQKDVDTNHEFKSENNKTMLIILRRFQHFLVKSVCSNEINNIFKCEQIIVFLTMTIDLMNTIFRYSEVMVYRKRLIKEIKKCKNAKAKAFLYIIVNDTMLNGLEWSEFFSDIILTDTE